MASVMSTEEAAQRKRTPSMIFSCMRKVRRRAALNRDAIVVSREEGRGQVLPPPAERFGKLSSWLRAS